MSGQNITVRDAGVTIESLRNVPRVTSGNLTFQDDNSYLYVIPGDGTIPNGQESVINPLGMTIHGFRAFLHEYSFGTESYTPVWDQANHRLTVMVTNSLHPGVSNAAAQFTLDGNYTASDFQVKFVEPFKTGQHPQIDITTTNSSNIVDNVLPVTQPGNSLPGSGVGPVYRFFDTSHGTHFFTADANEKNAVLQTRPDLVEETNGYGDVAPSDPAGEAVYRFFDGQYGTHFFTANAGEKANVQATRPDLTYEPSRTFYEHATQQAGDVAVYRFFDSNYGTHFCTGDQNEYNAITTPDSAAFCADLKYEGIEFTPQPAPSPDRTRWLPQPRAADVVRSQNVSTAVSTSTASGDWWRAAAWRSSSVCGCACTVGAEVPGPAQDALAGRAPLRLVMAERRFDRRLAVERVGQRERVFGGLGRPGADMRPGDEGGVADQRGAAGRQAGRIEVVDRLQERHRRHRNDGGERRREHKHQPPHASRPTSSGRISGRDRHRMRVATHVREQVQQAPRLLRRTIPHPIVAPATRPQIVVRPGHR